MYLGRIWNMCYHGKQEMGKPKMNETGATIFFYVIKSSFK